MKTKNFPERKRQRQLAALQRLRQRWNMDESRIPFSIEHELRKLGERTGNNLRHIRTKKNRSV